MQTLTAEIASLDLADGSRAPPRRRRFRRINPNRIRARPVEGDPVLSRLPVADDASNGRPDVVDISIMPEIIRHLDERRARPCSRRTAGVARGEVDSLGQVDRVTICRRTLPGPPRSWPARRSGQDARPACRSNSLLTCQGPPSDRMIYGARHVSRGRCQGLHHPELPRGRVLEYFSTRATDGFSRTPGGHFPFPWRTASFSWPRFYRDKGQRDGLRSRRRISRLSAWNRSGRGAEAARGGSTCNSRRRGPVLFSSEDRRRARFPIRRLWSARSLPWQCGGTSCKLVTLMIQRP